MRSKRRRGGPSGLPVEVRLARSGIAVALLLAGPAVGFAAWAAGRDGALSATIGAGIVIGMIGISAGLVAVLARFGPSGVIAGTLGGFGLRMMLYATLVTVLEPLDFVHGPSLAISTAVLLMAALFREAQVTVHAPELSWVDAGARPSSRPAGSGVVYSGHPTAAVPRSGGTDRAGITTSKGQMT